MIKTIFFIVICISFFSCSREIKKGDSDKKYKESEDVDSDFYKSYKSSNENKIKKEAADEVEYKKRLKGMDEYIENKNLKKSY